MSNHGEVSDFLTTRRARLTPEQAGVIGGGRRRVAGLRREEVAVLAGVSTDYYARMERGNLAGASPEVLDALARALQLDEAEIAHLHDLALGPSRTPAPAAASTGAERPSVAADAAKRHHRSSGLDHQPALGLAGYNNLGRALLSPLLNDPSARRNNARFTFLSPAAHAFYPDWEHGADSLVASMRAAAARNPSDRRMTDLIGELVTRSDAFRTRWAAHDVRFHRSGSKRLNHPDVGMLEFTFEGLELPGSPAWMLFAYTAPVGSPTADALELLAALAATPAADNSMK